MRAQSSVRRPIRHTRMGDLATAHSKARSPACSPRLGSDVIVIVALPPRTGTSPASAPVNVAIDNAGHPRFVHASTLVAPSAALVRITLREGVDSSRPQRGEDAAGGKKLYHCGNKNPSNHNALAIEVPLRRWCQRELFDAPRARRHSGGGQRRKNGLRWRRVRSLPCHRSGAIRNPLLQRILAVQGVSL